MNNPNLLSSSKYKVRAGESIDFFDQSSYSPKFWEWKFPGASLSISSEQNPSNIRYDQPGTYDVELFVTNERGGDIMEKKCLIEVIPTNNSEQQLMPIDFYPNPVIDYLFIKFPNDYLEQIFSIVNSSGVKVMENKIISVSTNINIQHLKSGIYFLRIQDHNSSYIKFLVH